MYVQNKPPQPAMSVSIATGCGQRGVFSDQKIVECQENQSRPNYRGFNLGEIFASPERPALPRFGGQALGDWATRRDGPRAQGDAQHVPTTEGWLYPRLRWLVETSPRRLMSGCRRVAIIPHKTAPVLKFEKTRMPIHIHHIYCPRDRLHKFCGGRF